MHRRREPGTFLSPRFGLVRWQRSATLSISRFNEGTIFALDARTGKQLRNSHSGGQVSSNPISFNLDGHPHIAIAANRVLYVMGPVRSLPAPVCSSNPR